MNIYTNLFLFLLQHVYGDFNSLSISDHSAWKFLDQFECGFNVADRIIGGVNAQLGQFPWIARLGYEDGGEIEWMCGGALISDRHVLTAAHCVAAEGYVLTTIRLGEYDVKSDTDCVLDVCAPAVQDRAVKKVTSHSKFNIPAFHNDISLIELMTPVDINPYVTPICLPRDETLGNPKIGELMTVAGWGKMNMSTERSADILQVVTIPVVKSTVCDGFGKSFRLTDGEICAGAQRNRDACAGDSGGPLMKVFDTPDGPKHFLIGVVSFGPTLCGSQKPGVYSSVSYFIEWVLDHLSSKI